MEMFSGMPKGTLPSSMLTQFYEPATAIIGKQFMIEQDHGDSGLVGVLIDGVPITSTSSSEVTPWMDRDSGVLVIPLDCILKGDHHVTFQVEAGMDAAPVHYKIADLGDDGGSNFLDAYGSNLGAMQHHETVHVADPDAAGVADEPDSPDVDDAPDVAVVVAVV